jgi:hypothetical protein
MPDEILLRPAMDEDIAQRLAFALQVDSRKRVHHADDFMDCIKAQRLVIEHLERSGCVLMKKPPAPAPSASPAYERP